MLDTKIETRMPNDYTTDIQTFMPKDDKYDIETEVPNKRKKKYRDPCEKNEICDEKCSVDPECDPECGYDPECDPECPKCVKMFRKKREPTTKCVNINGTPYQIRPAGLHCAGSHIYIVAGTMSIYEYEIGFDNGENAYFMDFVREIQLGDFATGILSNHTMDPLGDVFVITNGITGRESGRWVSLPSGTWTSGTIDLCCISGATGDYVISQSPSGLLSIEGYCSGYVIASPTDVTYPSGVRGICCGTAFKMIDNMNILIGELDIPDVRPYEEETVCQDHGSLVYYGKRFESGEIVLNAHAMKDGSLLGGFVNVSIQGEDHIGFITGVKYNAAPLIYDWDRHGSEKVGECPTSSVPLMHYWHEEARCKRWYPGYHAYGFFYFKGIDGIYFSDKHIAWSDKMVVFMGTVRENGSMTNGIFYFRHDGKQIFHVVEAKLKLLDVSDFTRPDPADPDECESDNISTNYDDAVLDISIYNSTTILVMKYGLIRAYDAL